MPGDDHLIGLVVVEEVLPDPAPTGDCVARWRFQVVAAVAAGVPAEHPVAA